MISLMSSIYGSITLFFMEWRRDIKKHGTNSVSIIGGADGPTSVFIAGRSGKRPLKDRIRNAIYKFKRKRMEKKICASAHTLEEVLAYANERFIITEVLVEDRNYIEQRNCLKASLVLKYKPELMKDINEIVKPAIWDEESVKDFSDQLQARSERIAEISDEQMPMDFHIYEIHIEDGRLEIEIDYIWNIFGISHSGSKNTMKRLRKISQELYLYYGVSEEDIKLKSERYRSLLSILCS